MFTDAFFDFFLKEALHLELLTQSQRNKCEAHSAECHRTTEFSPLGKEGESSSLIFSIPISHYNRGISLSDVQ